MIASHSCGAVWIQRASQTGHCAACHLTFATEEAFEIHRRNTSEGRTCVTPAGCVKRDGSPALSAKHDGHSLIWSRKRTEKERPSHWKESGDGLSDDTKAKASPDYLDFTARSLKGLSPEPLAMPEPTASVTA